MMEIISENHNRCTINVQNPWRIPWYILEHRTRFGWDTFGSRHGLAVDRAHLVGMAGGGNQMHRSYVCLIKGTEEQNNQGKVLGQGDYRVVDSITDHLISCSRQASKQKHRLLGTSREEDLDKLIRNCERVKAEGGNALKLFSGAADSRITFLECHIPTRSSFNNKTNMFVPDSGPELIAGNKPAPVRLPK
ncbi:hypothetical protein GEV33_012569 [Tenebrio molitor]|uniref:Uncharacterized protein n=1 Tax=Tenebrio molitor TaxID=7067 RepID=A0A8J6H9H4_TENMO|nr:hypothetical protein GEV33_012569 [Tenebrio molitor]